MQYYRIVSKPFVRQEPWGFAAVDANKRIQRHLASNDLVYNRALTESREGAKHKKEEIAVVFYVDKSNKFS